LAEIVVKTEASETKHRCIRENLKTSQKSLASPVHWLLDMREKWRWPEARVAHFNRWQSEVLGRWECRKTACCADVTGTTGHCRKLTQNNRRGVIHLLCVLFGFQYVQIVVVTATWQNRSRLETCVALKL